MPTALRPLDVRLQDEQMAIDVNGNTSKMLDVHKSPCERCPPKDPRLDADFGFVPKWDPPPQRGDPDLLPRGGRECLEVHRKRASRREGGTSERGWQKQSKAAYRRQLVVFGARTSLFGLSLCKRFFIQLAKTLDLSKGRCAQRHAE